MWWYRWVLVSPYWMYNMALSNKAYQIFTENENWCFEGYNGPTVCEAPSYCCFYNIYESQCLPSNYACPDHTPISSITTAISTTSSSKSTSLKTTTTPKETPRITTSTTVGESTKTTTSSNNTTTWKVQSPWGTCGGICKFDTTVCSLDGSTDSV